MRDGTVLVPGPEVGSVLRVPAPDVAPPPAWAGARARPGLLSRAWDAYLFAVVALAAVVVPGGPAQTALLDPLNGLALLAFGAAVIARPTRVELPFLIPNLVALAGSLVAMTNANAIGNGFLTLAQDVY